MVRFCAGPCAARLDLDGGLSAPATTDRWRRHCAILLKQLLPSLVVTFSRRSHRQLSIPQITLRFSRPLSSPGHPPPRPPLLNKYRPYLYQDHRISVRQLLLQKKRRLPRSLPPFVSFLFLLRLVIVTASRLGDASPFHLDIYLSAQTLIINSIVCVCINSDKSPQSRSNCKLSSLSSCHACLC